MVELIRAENLGYRYPGGVQALSGVDLSVESGDLLAILGPNGAGKSTLLRALAQLVETDSGSVEWRGENLASCTPRERARRVAFVPQALQALPEVTVETFVAQGRYAHMGPFSRPRGADYEAIRRALDEADLVELAERPMTALSGGQRQRALVARALAQESELLLVDEPTNALDPAHQLGVLELIARLTGAGRGAVVVTHDLNLASQFATRALLLQEGRVAADAPVEAVLTRAVLEPVYGDVLRYASWSQTSGAQLPIVLPWREA